MGKQKHLPESTGDLREPSDVGAVKEGSRGRYRRPARAGASTLEEARHEASHSSQSPNLVVHSPPAEAKTVPTEDADARRLWEQMRVETVRRKADAETEEVAAQLGIALWLSKPARRKAA